ncbi:MAG: peptide chain release factor N(5)-glutamine methyltransferase [Gammaproteobacteria bacterium]
MPATSIKDSLNKATRQLSNNSESATLDAEVLLAHMLGRSRTYLHTWPEQILNTEQQSSFNTLIEKRVAGVPVAYLTGSKEFWSLNLSVTPATLIPRADTEVLVEGVLEIVDPDQRIRILDLGTGSGAIALALARERPHSEIVATDISSAAIQVATKNAERFSLTNVEFLTGEWFDAIDSKEKFGLIVSNPPYIAENDPHLRQGDLLHEPRQALIAENNGLHDIELITAHAKSYLSNKGWLAIEHGFDQYDEVNELFRCYDYANIKQRRDITNHYRVTLGQLTA